MMKKIFALLIILFFILIGFLIIYKGYFSMRIKTVTINGTKINVELAETSSQRNKGLSGRKKLPEKQGMLFIYDNPSYYSFWMEDMLIPLDFIWINQGKIVEISENVSPQDYQPPKSLVPKQKVDKVLEVSAGTVKKFDFKVGDEVRFN
jgi:hypothetical protein